jgi:hypothetical protein
VSISPRAWGGLLLLPVGLAAFLVFDHGRAKPDSRRFDPDVMGATEAAMWRDYYDGRWPVLGFRMMGLVRGQYGFSWWDSARASCHATRAAWYFRRQTDDPRCEPALRDFYTVLRRAMPPGFSPDEAARLELQWWSERRREVPPASYGRTIAALAGMCLGISAGAAESSSLLRAEMMAYRDARRDGRMDESDWERVAAGLREAWSGLREVIGGG